MSFAVKTTTDPKDAAEEITASIFRKLKQRKRVLFCLAGGSAIKVGLEVSALLKDEDKENLKNLTITLTDERFGPIGHPDSNWQQLLEKGFFCPQAKLVPVLAGDDLAETARRWADSIQKEFEAAEYKIGLFGIGADGHTAGILPGSDALGSENFAFGYKTEKFDRITMTLKAIEKIDEAFVWMQGSDKWPVLENLDKEMDIRQQPAQILKKVPLLTIFTDYNKSSKT
jgi:6-phosphogluconolactonase/glucosamine-6-phosphate isomerase/deaminase